MFSANEVVRSSPDAVLVFFFSKVILKKKFSSGKAAYSFHFPRFLFLYIPRAWTTYPQHNTGFSSPVPHTSVFIRLIQKLSFSAHLISFSSDDDPSRKPQPFLFFHHPVGVPWSFHDKCRNCRHWMAALARLKIHWCELISKISGSENSLSYSHYCSVHCKSARKFTSGNIAASRRHPVRFPFTMGLLKSYVEIPTP